jgi:hypothetical protein
MTHLSKTAAQAKYDTAAEKLLSHLRATGHNVVTGNCLQCYLLTNVAHGRANDLNHDELQGESK